MTRLRQLVEPAGWALLIAVVTIAPLIFTDAYTRSLIILIGIYAVLAISYDIVVGHAGVISFGHAGFFALGAYAMGITATRWDWPLVASMGLAVVLGVLVSLLLGAVSLRISGHYFAISTLAFAELFRMALLNVDSVTRGPLGLVIPPGSVDLVPGIVLEGQLMIHFLVWGTVLLATYGIFRMQVSRLGWAFRALRENEQLASAVGLHPLKVRVMAFAMSGALAGIAGVYYAAYYGVLTPDVSGARYTTIALLIIMLGGRGTIAGPIIGAMAYVILPEIFNLEGSWNEVVFGVVLLIILRVLPKGLSHGFKYLGVRPDAAPVDNVATGVDVKAGSR